jgi:hypothetical protein
MRIVTGGQQGIDRLGLEVAKELGLLTGGFAPKGYRTEDGNDPSLAEFGLKEHWSTEYNPRTELNVQLSAGTIIFGDSSSPGSKSTMKFIDKHKKPYLINPTVEQIKEFVRTKDIINIAGNRASKLTPEQLSSYRDTLKQGLS